MNQITKTVQQIGNGGHIYLPREMVGKKIIVSLKEKSIGEIEEEIIQILKPYLKHIKGIYLHGSYARNEQTPDSDIDVLVVTGNKVKIKKRINEYELTSISENQLQQSLDYTAVLILPILREAKPILNQGLIEKYKGIKFTKKNTKWYIETTESSIKLAKDWISDKDIKSLPNIIYPLVLRLRGLYLIETLVNNKQYSNKDVVNIIKKRIKKNKAEQIYRIYREHRDDKNISENSVNYDDVSELYKVADEYFKRVKLLWAKLK